MGEQQHSSASNFDQSHYSGKLWSSSPIAQEPLLLLAELASELSTATDFEKLQQILSRKLRWLLDFDRCTLAVRSHVETEYLLFELTSPSKAKNIPPQKIPIAQGWSGKVLRDSKPYFIEDLTDLLPSITAPPNDYWGIADQARSVMLLPLRVGDRTIGSLNFSSCTVRAYSTAWRNLASLLSSQIGGQLGSILAQEQLRSAYEFRERVMESATDAIFTLDLKGNFTLINQRTVELTGYPERELLGMSFLNLFENPNQIQTLLLDIINQGITVKEYDAEIISKDHNKKIISFNLAPLFLAGKISVIALTAQDITERKQTESALLRAKVAEAANIALESQVQERTLQLQQALNFEARLKRITDKVRDSLDESQIVQTAVEELALGLNVGCCNMAFYNLEQGTSTISHEYAISIPASQGRIAQMANFPELYRQLLQNQYFQFCSILPHPKRGQVAMLACPIADDQGVMGDLWLINQHNYVFNQSEIRLVQQVANQCAIAIRQARLYQAAQAQVEELEKLNQLKDDFLSTVSHELRTPVSNMKMSIHMLKIASTAAARERYLEILQNECKREIELINDLLDLQRLEAAAYTTSQEVVNLQDWLPGIIKPFEVRTQERQQKLRLDLSSFLPAIVSDTTILGRILSELLNNACKYTPEAGEIAFSCYTLDASKLEELEKIDGIGAVREAKQFSLVSPIPSESLPNQSAANRTSTIIFQSSNQAEIPQDQLPHIFKKFYRVPGGDRWKQGGTGLGLALVQKLVQVIGGTISVESSEGWTSFTVQLKAIVV